MLSGENDPAMSDAMAISALLVAEDESAMVIVVEESAMFDLLRKKRVSGDVCGSEDDEGEDEAGR